MPILDGFDQQGFVITIGITLIIEKIDTKNLVVQPADTYYTSLTRTYKQDSRNNTLSFIQSIIRNSYFSKIRYGYK